MVARGTAGNTEPAAIVETLRAFLSLHEDGRFKDIDERGGGWRSAPPQRTVHRRAGWRKRFETGPEYFIEPHVFRTEIYAGYDIVLVCRVLAEAGYLHCAVEGGQVRYTLHRQFGEDGRRRVYVVNGTIWDNEDQQGSGTGDVRKDGETESSDDH